MPVNCLAIFQQLLGRWTINRVFKPQQAKLVGTAHFKQSHSDYLLNYQEVGQLQLANGYITQATRSYIYRYKNDAISVYFKDSYDISTDCGMRLFHTLHFLRDTPIAQASYLCKHDNYQLRYTFYNAHSFNLICCVKGPRKDYFIETLFERITQ